MSAKISSSDSGRKGPHEKVGATSARTTELSTAAVASIVIAKRDPDAIILLMPSDHVIGDIVSLAAVARGANVIEKHVTLNKKMAGPDHAASLKFKEFEDCVNIAKKIYECFHE